MIPVGLLSIASVRGRTRSIARERLDALVTWFRHVEGRPEGATLGGQHGGALDNDALVIIDLLLDRGWVAPDFPAAGDQPYAIGVATSNRLFDWFAADFQSINPHIWLRHQDASVGLRTHRGLPAEWSHINPLQPIPTNEVERSYWRSLLLTAFETHAILPPWTVVFNEG